LVQPNRDFAFSILVPGNPNETLLAAANVDDFEEWINALERQCFLTFQAERRDLSLDVQGNFYDAQGSQASVQKHP
jgi:hypothetical protein